MFLTAIVSLADVAHAQDPKATYTYTHRKQITFDQLIQRTDRREYTRVPFIWHRGVHAVWGGPAQKMGGDDVEIWKYKGTPIQENSFMSYALMASFSNRVSYANDARVLDVTYEILPRPGFTTPAAQVCKGSDMISEKKGCANILSEFPAMVEADPRRTRDGVFYAHHDETVDRDKQTDSWRANGWSTKLKDMNESQFKGLVTIYWQPNQSRIKCMEKLACEAASMDEVFQLIADKKTILALHMHSREETVALASYMFEWEIKNGKTLFDKSFFLVPISALGSKTGDFNDIKDLWTDLNDEISSLFWLSNLRLSASNRYPKVYVNVNLWTGVKNISGKSFRTTKADLLKTYPIVNGKTGGDKRVTFFGLGLSDDGKNSTVTSNLNLLGTWAKSNGFHSIKATIHPEMTGSNNQFCFRATDGFPKDISKAWCPGYNKQRLITYVMGTNFVDHSAFSAPREIAKKYGVGYDDRNVYTAPTIVTSDRPLLDSKFKNYGTTDDTRVASDTDKY